LDRAKHVGTWIAQAEHDGQSHRALAGRELALGRLDIVAVLLMSSAD
jgi:hypothetical protein